MNQLTRSFITSTYTYIKSISERNCYHAKEKKTRCIYVLSFQQHQLTGCSSWGWSMQLMQRKPVPWISFLHITHTSSWGRYWRSDSEIRFVGTGVSGRLKVCGMQWVRSKIIKGLGKWLSSVIGHLHIFLDETVIERTVSLHWRWF